MGRKGQKKKSGPYFFPGSLSVKKFNFLKSNQSYCASAIVKINFMRYIYLL